MSEQPTPARTYYTAQELADLAFSWGASTTFVGDDGQVVIELERNGDILQLSLGPRQEFYDEVICKGWVSVPAAPHKACDHWNELPYFGTYSVVCDEHGTPVQDELGFVLRGVRIIEFDRAESEDELMAQILHFWFTLAVIQEHVLSGSIRLTEIERLKLPGAVTRWWFGDMLDEDAT